MSSRLSRALAALALALPALGAASPPLTPQGRLTAQVRQLEKEIEAVRGLKFKSPVIARVRPRPKGMSPRIQGYYSTKDEALVVFDDVKSSYRKGTLVHEMVHALQDQHFGLQKLHDRAYSSDAEMARAALVEGDAVYTMILVLRKEQPNVGKMLASRLDNTKNLQGTFVYAEGARWVRALHERGGWAAVNARYRFPPSSTLAILNPGAPPPLNLGPGKVLGAFGLLEKASGFPGTPAVALKLAKAWRGDREVEVGKGRAWVVALADEDSAARLAALFPPTPYGPQKGGPGAWQDHRGWHSVIRSGKRVTFLDAPDEKGMAALRERLEGPLALEIWSAKDKRALTFGELTDRLLQADIVCVGETHDSEMHHRLQLQIIRALHARDDRLGVGLEMFQRPYQKALDRYVSRATNEASMLEDTQYLKRWGYDWSLYKPIADFCRSNGVPMAALNAPFELTRRLSMVGHGKLTAEERKALGDVDFHHKEHRAYWYERLAKMHGGKGKTPPERKERSYQVMTAWDDYMAQSAAAFQKERKLRRLVVLAGSGHIDRGFGIPLRAARRTGGKAATVHVALGGDLEKLKADPPADYVIVIR